MNMQKLIFAAVVVAVSLTSASAFANCVFTGRPTHIFTHSPTVTDRTTVYIYNGSYFLSVMISNSYPEALNAVRDAVTWKKSISVVSDVSSCPTVGTLRYGGFVNHAWVIPG